jgi:hypothetical protein
VVRQYGRKRQTLRPRAPRLTRGAPTGGRQGGLDPAEPQRAPRGCPGPASGPCDAQLRPASCEQRPACAIPPRARGAGPRAPLTAAAAAQARKGETVAVKIDAVNDQQEGCPLPPLLEVNAYICIYIYIYIWGMEEGCHGELRKCSLPWSCICPSEVRFPCASPMCRRARGEAGRSALWAAV